MCRGGSQRSARWGSTLQSCCKSSDSPVGELSRSSAPTARVLPVALEVERGGVGENNGQRVPRRSCRQQCRHCSEGAPSLAPPRITHLPVLATGITRAVARVSILRRGRTAPAGQRIQPVGGTWWEGGRGGRSEWVRFHPSTDHFGGLYHSRCNINSYSHIMQEISKRKRDA